MLDNLTARLAKIVKTIRGEARLTEANIQEALREVRVALLEADVALPVVKHFIDCGARRRARRGSGRQPDAGPGAGGRGAPRAHQADGRGERRPRSRHAAAGGDPDGGTAGLGQDHDHRQARALAGQGQEEGRGGFRRRLSPGGDRAAEDAWRARPARLSLRQRQRKNPSTSRAARSTTRARITWTCSSSTPPAASRSTRR